MRWPDARGRAWKRAWTDPGDPEAGRSCSPNGPDSNGAAARAPKGQEWDSNPGPKAGTTAQSPLRRRRKAASSGLPHTRPSGARGLVCLPTATPLAGSRPPWAIAGAPRVFAAARPAHCIGIAGHGHGRMLHCKKLRQRHNMGISRGPFGEPPTPLTGAPPWPIPRSQIQNPPMRR